MTKELVKLLSYFHTVKAVSLDIVDITAHYLYRFLLKDKKPFLYLIKRFNYLCLIKLIHFISLLKYTLEKTQKLCYNKQNTHFNARS